MLKPNTQNVSGSAHTSGEFSAVPSTQSQPLLFPLKALGKRGITKGTYSNFPTTIKQDVQSPNLVGSPTLLGSGGLIYHQAIMTEPTTTSGDGQNGSVTGHNSVVSGASVASTPSQGQATPVSPTAEKEEGETNMANIKEKTPMCLINELARYNKVAHQYTLVDEQGPAHKKTFFVKLKLGEEEYSASGESIKKAQHAAAAIALNVTKFPHPVPKPARYQDRTMMECVDNVTPTVELNALAMKRGEPAVYKLIEPRNQQQLYSPPNIDFRGLYNQRYHYGRPPRPFYVSLKVGQREFIGEGNTRQAARHSAASKALRILRNLPMPNNNVKLKEEKEESNNGMVDDMKSEISLVHEIALKRNLAVTFEVVNESGPPHMKNFITACQVGDLVTQAEGSSKKSSKKRAAELMLDELMKLPALPNTVAKPKLKPPVHKKKNRNIIKKADPSYGVGINPISRLIQIMQAQKKREPVYTLLAEKGLPRRREFVMQVTVDDQSSQGVGPNKKLAKRNAAESMLQLLGFSRPSPQPAKSAIKSTPSSEAGSNSDKKVTFVEGSKPYGNGVPGEDVGGKSGCQLVPGLLRINQAGSGTGNSNVYSGLVASTHKYNYTGQPESRNSVIGNAGSRTEQQLQELNSRLRITTNYEEFSKSISPSLDPALNVMLFHQENSSEHLTRLTLSQVHHGTGPSLEVSRDASYSAIQTLLSASHSSSNPETSKAAGDVGVLKKESNIKLESSTVSLSHRLNGAGDQM